MTEAMWFNFRPSQLAMNHERTTTSKLHMKQVTTGLKAGSDGSIIIERPWQPACSIAILNKQTSDRGCRNI